MVNDNMEEGGPWYQGSSDEKKVREVVKPMVYPSKLTAKRVIARLSREAYTTDWWVERYNV